MKNELRIPSTFYASNVNIISLSLFSNVRSKFKENRKKNNNNTDSQNRYVCTNTQN